MPLSDDVAEVCGVLTRGVGALRARRVDVAVPDISAVAYDWLATAKPLLVTRPAEPRAQLPESGLVREMTLLDAADTGRAPAIIDAAVAHPEGTHAALVRHYVGDTGPGSSMERFLNACSTVVDERQAALTARGSLPGN